jgi:SAM-dependent methyltransferase
MGFAKELYTKHYYENLVLGAKEWRSGGIRPEHEALLKLVDVKDKKVLDLGCGRGDAMRWCLQHGATVTGIDFSPAAIALAKETLSGYTYSLEAGDALDVLPTLTDKFDVILMLDSIEHIPAKEIKLILHRLYNMLAEGGRILVNTPYYKVYEDYIENGVFLRPSPTDKNPLTSGMHCTKYTQGRLVDLMMEMGFQCLDMKAALFKKLDYQNQVVCAFYTENTPYEQEIALLRESLVKLGLKYYFKPFKTLSKWEFNCGMKPAFIKECLLRYNKDVIMYTDADSVLQRWPDYLDGFDSDIAVHHLGGKELLSGTIVLQSNAHTLAFIDNWILEQSMTPNEWDQKVLERVLKADKVMRVAELPLEYIQIFDHGVQCAAPVVVHNQASRRFKNAVVVMGVTEVFLPAFVKGWRKLDDGSIYIPRINREIEKYMDTMYCRVTGENRWWPIAVDPTVLESIRGIHKCEISIIGKGPSLDRFTKEHVTGPTIALNEAFTATQKLGVQYGTQQDAWMKDACYPHSGVLFCSPRAKLHYAGVKNAKLLDPRQLKLSAMPASLEYAMAIAVTMGATSVRLCCFDALTTGDCNYASVIGYDPTNMGDPKRFLKHGGVLEKFKLPVTYFTP